MCAVLQHDPYTVMKYARLGTYHKLTCVVQDFDIKFSIWKIYRIRVSRRFHKTITRLVRFARLLQKMLRQRLVRPLQRLPRQRLLLLPRHRLLLLLRRRRRKATPNTHQQTCAYSVLECLKVKCLQARESHLHTHTHRAPICKATNTKMSHRRLAAPDCARMRTAVSITKSERRPKMMEWMRPS